MANFTYRRVEDDKTMEVTLRHDFSHDDQEQLMGIIQERVNGGVIYWDLNLTQMQTLNSFVLGMVVTINAVLVSRNGDLRLILNRQSKVASLLHLAKLDKIMRFVYV